MRALIKVAKLAVIIAPLVIATSAWAADHRDSPQADDDPAADINDVYMFRDPADATKLVFVLSTYPLENPRFATSYQYDPDVVFRIGFDKTGNGTFDGGSVLVQFSPLTAGAGSQQTYTVTLPNGATVSGNVTLPTIQNTEPTPAITTQNGVTAFAGQSDDPFFFDLIGFNRVVAEINAKGVVDPSLFSGVDAFAGFNVLALVIEAPVSCFVGDATKFGISAFSYRKTNGKSASDSDRHYINIAGLNYVQVDRMGNPAVNTAFIPSALKDMFNNTEPKDDEANYESAILATLAKYGTNSSNTALLASIVFPDTLKMDLSQPDGFPNGRRLTDDPLTLELQVTFNQTVGGSFTDGATKNDVPFRTTFPFVAPPHIVTP